MTDFVLVASSQEVMQTALQRTGFWREQTPAGPITQGRIPGDDDPMSSYFMNIVGDVWLPTGETTQGNPVAVMAQQEGYFARLRINGRNPFATGLLTMPEGVTSYWQEAAEDSGETYWRDVAGNRGPDWLSAVGCIA